MCENEPFLFTYQVFYLFYKRSFERTSVNVPFICLRFSSVEITSCGNCSIPIKLNYVVKIVPKITISVNTAEAQPDCESSPNTWWPVFTHCNSPFIWPSNIWLAMSLWLSSQILSYCNYHVHLGLSKLHYLKDVSFLFYPFWHYNVQRKSMLSATLWD